MWEEEVLALTIISVLLPGDGCLCLAAAAAGVMFNVGQDPEAGEMTSLAASPAPALGRISGYQTQHALHNNY